jgi:hypothetical protein
MYFSFILFTIHMILMASGDRCGEPLVCDCIKVLQYSVADCTFQNLTKIVQFSEHHYKFLEFVHFAHNNISEILPHDFEGYLSLKQINLEFNPFLQCNTLINIPTGIRYTSQCHLHTSTTTDSSRVTGKEIQNGKRKKCVILYLYQITLLIFIL